MLDQPLWAKTEQLFKKWQGHLKIDDLVPFAVLVSKNQHFCSSKLIVSLEHRLKKNQAAISEKHLCTLIQHFLPSANDLFKQFLVQLLLKARSLSRTLQLRSLIQVLGHTTSHAQQVIQLLLDLSQTREFSSVEELVYFLQVFYSELPHAWLRRTKTRQLTQGAMSGIIYGYM